GRDPVPAPRHRALDRGPAGELADVAGRRPHGRARSRRRRAGHPGDVAVNALEVEDVSRRFGGVVALDGCCLAVPEGAIMGLIGPNGSGKTTLFDTITGFGRPDGGRLTYRTRSIGGLRPDVISGLGIGRTFQTPRVFPRLTVLENLLVGARSGREVGRAR